MKKKLDPALKKAIDRIQAPYKRCAKKLGLDYSKKKSWSWSTKVKVRRCVMSSRKAK